MAPFLLIRDPIVRQSISVEECIQAVEQGFLLQASGKVGDAYGHLSYQEGASSLHLYAASVPEFGVGAKVLGAYRENPGNGRPYIRACVVLLDPVTGEMEAFLDGAYLTALRTGAATALGAHYLARQDSRVLGIMGTGLHARTHLLCHLSVHEFQRVVIWGRNPQHIAEYLKEMQSMIDLPIFSLPSPDDVCAQADVIACTTSARSPLFQAKAVRPGTHIGVAAPVNSWQTEIPLDLLDNSLLFVDSIAKFHQNWAPGAAPIVEAELGQVIAGLAVGRSTDKDITIFKPEGMGFEDIVSARIVVDRVRQEQSTEIVVW